MTAAPPRRPAHRARMSVGEARRAGQGGSGVPARCQPSPAAGQRLGSPQGPAGAALPLCPRSSRVSHRGGNERRAAPATRKPAESPQPRAGARAAPQKRAGRPVHRHGRGRGAGIRQPSRAAVASAGSNAAAVLEFHPLRAVGAPGAGLPGLLTAGLACLRARPGGPAKEGGPFKEGGGASASLRGPLRASRPGVRPRRRPNGREPAPTARARRAKGWNTRTAAAY